MMNQWLNSLELVRQDIQKNVSVLARDMAARMGMVEREEFEIQKRVLLRTRLQITELEERLREKEAEGLRQAQDRKKNDHPNF